jgi:hypothetical protein
MIITSVVVFFQKLNCRGFRDRTNLFSIEQYAGVYVSPSLRFPRHSAVFAARNQGGAG